MARSFTLLGSSLRDEIRRSSLILVSLGLFAGCEKPIDLDQAMQSAQAAFYNKEFSEMEIHLKAILNVDPDNGHARLLRGISNLELGKGIQAETDLKKALLVGINPSQVMVPMMKAWMFQQEFLRVIGAKNEDMFKFSDLTLSGKSLATVDALIGRAHLVLDETDEARLQFESALRLDPNNGLALVGNAMLAAKLNDSEQIEKSLVKAREMSPQDPGAWSFSASWAMAQKRLKQAEEFYSNALELRPFHIADLYRRGYLRAIKQDYNGALTDIAVLEDLGAEMPHGMFLRALVFYVQGQLKQALDTMARMNNEKSDLLPITNCLQGAILAELNLAERALRQCEICLSAYPLNSSNRRIYATVLASLGEFPKAIELLQPILAVDSRDPASLQLRANIERMRGNPEAAVDFLKALFENDSYDSNLHLDMGLALTEAGLLEKAKKEFDSFIEKTGGDNRRLIESLAYLHAGRLSEAIKLLNELVAADPSDSRALNHLGIAHGSLKELDKANEYFRKALDIEPDYHIAAVNRAKILVQLGDFPPAEKLLLRVLDTDAGNAKALGILTFMYHKQGEFDKAKSAVDAALQGKQSSAELLLVKSAFERSYGDFRESASTLTRLVETYGRKVEWLRKLARSNLDAGNLENAITILREIISISPKSPSDRMQLALMLEGIGDHESAVNAAEAAVELEPSYPFAGLFLIKNQIRKGDVASARANFESLSKRAPNPHLPELLAVEAYLNLAEGNLIKAQELFETVFSKEPTSSRLIQLVRAYTAIGKPEKAISTLRDWITKKPKDRTARFVLADTLSKTGNESGSIAEYEAILKTIGDDPIVLNNLAELLLKSNPSIALAHAKQALQLAPDSPGILNTYGKILLAKNETGKALGYLEKAFKLAPGNSTLALNTAQALVALGNYADAQRLVENIDPNDLSEVNQQVYERLREAL